MKVGGRRRRVEVEKNMSVCIISRLLFFTLRYFEITAAVAVIFAPTQIEPN